MGRFPDVSGMKGPGYETTDKDNFDHTIQIIVDYKDTGKTTRELKQIMSDFSNNIREMNKELGTRGNRSDLLFDVSPKAGMRAASMVDQTGKQIIDITLPPGGKDLAAILKPEMQYLGQYGKQTMLQYANRIDTGRMRGSIHYTTRVTDKRAVVTIGWTKLWYKYFGFQENGTMHVSPMHSVLRTIVHILPPVQKLLSQVFRSR